MLLVILPLLLDYLDNPFELIQINRTCYKYGKKYKLTFVTEKKYNRQFCKCLNGNILI